MQKTSKDIAKKARVSGTDCKEAFLFDYFVKRFAVSDLEGQIEILALSKVSQDHLRKGWLDAYST